MGINGISAAGSYAGGQMSVKAAPDTAGKKIENQISEAQREKQALSSKQDLTPEEKNRKSRELQQEIGSLNVKLRQRLEQADKEQKKKEAAQELREPENGGEESKGAKEKTSAVKASEQDVKVSGAEDRGVQSARADEKTVQEKESEKKAEETAAVQAEEKDAAKTAGMTSEETRKIISADADAKRARQQERVVARMEEGIVVLKGEIKQDELRGGNTDKKREELAKRENRRNQEFPPKKIPATERTGRADKTAAAQKTDAGMMAANGANRIANRPMTQAPEANLFGF